MACEAKVKLLTSAETERAKSGATGEGGAPLSCRQPCTHTESECLLSIGTFRMLVMVARGGGAGGVTSFSLPDWATGPCVGDGIASMRRGRINIWQSTVEMPGQLPGPS